MQQARITVDPSYYPKAEATLRRSLELQPTGNVDALVGMASLTAARHDFAASLDWAERALAMSPGDADAYAVVGDAQIELGRYDDAFAVLPGHGRYPSRPELVRAGVVRA